MSDQLTACLNCIMGVGGPGAELARNELAETYDVLCDIFQSPPIISDTQGPDGTATTSEMSSTTSAANATSSSTVLEESTRSRSTTSKTTGSTPPAEPTEADSEDEPDTDGAGLLTPKGGLAFAWMTGLLAAAALL